MAERDEAVYALMSPLLFASTKGVTPSLLLEILLSKKTCCDQSLLSVGKEFQEAPLP